MLRCLWLWTLCSRLFLFPASSHRGTPKEERGEGYGSVTVYGVRFGSAVSTQPGQIRDQRPLAIGNGECSMPPRGPGWGRGGGNRRVSGDHTAHRVCCVAASALWENERHEVFLFWTIWCPRDPKPKKTRTEEAEPAMLKHAGETSPSGIAQGSSRRFSTRMRVLMTRTDSLLEAPSGSVKPGAKGITPQTDGSHWKLRDLMHIPWAQPGEHALR